jgi:transposase
MKATKSFERVYLHRRHVDMRKGINGLYDLVAQAAMGNLSGANLFVFTGRQRHSIKILYFDKSGFCLWQKRVSQFGMFYLISGANHFMSRVMKPIFKS